MGVARAQTVTEDRASGAQVIDGSLSFNSSKTSNISTTFSSTGTGTRKTWTMSFWMKRIPGTSSRFVSTGYRTDDGTYGFYIGFNSDLLTYVANHDSIGLDLRTGAVLRDIGWYHLVFTLDTTQGTAADRAAIYINGEKVTSFNTESYPGQNTTPNWFNTSKTHTIGAWELNGAIADGTDANLSQFYCIDGQVLDASYFGFTDPLTGVWRPKKYEGTYGTNGFWLPFDGSAPIGEDQSGQGNHWGTGGGGGGGNLGHGSLDIATGGFPILNTKSGGKLATPGVRGQVGIAVTVYDDGGGNKFYLDGVKTGSINVIPGQRVTFDTSSSTLGSHPFRISSVSNGLHNAMYGVEFDGSNDKLTIPDNADFELGSGDFTIEAWVKGDDANQQSYTTVVSKFQSSNFSWMIRWSSDDIEREAWSFFYSTTGSNYITIAGAPLDDYKWHHVAVARSGGTIRCYTDGILNGTKTTSDTFYSGTADVVIGSDQNSNYFDGKISDLRVTKGEAIYTGSSFSPPSSPMTTTSQGATASNVKLLCCNGAAVTDSTVTPGTITNSGSTASNDNPYDYYQYAVVTDISDGSAGAATTITIPHNAPTNLYYFCTAHSGMGGSATIGIGSADSNIADPYAWKNIYSSSFAANTNNNALTANVNPSDVGDPAIVKHAGTTADSHFYGSNLYLDGNDALSLGVINGTDLEFGGYDWCVEFWVNSNTTLDSGYWNPILSMPWHGSSNSYSQIWIGFAGGASGSYTTGELHSRLNAKVSGSLVKTELDTNNTKVYNDQLWHHVAVTKEHKTARIYLDGVKTDEASIGFAMNPDLQSTTGWIGAYANHDTTSGTSISAYMTGYLNDFRIYKGIAKYTQDRFIPASTNPNIVPDSPSGVSYSSALDEPTSGCVAFDGSGDYIKQTVTTTLSRFATQAFTVEYWVKGEAFANSGNTSGSTVIGVTNPTSNPEDWSFGPKGSGEVIFYYWNGSIQNLNSGFLLATDRWYHLALVHDGSNNLKIFVDGKIVKTGTISGTPTGTSPNLSIGQVANAAFKGKVSNVRITHSAVYTDQFTPSTKPLTNITNTKLLCCQSVGVTTFAAQSPNVFTAVGNAQADPENPFDNNINFVQGKASGYCELNVLDQKSGTIRDQLTYTNSGESNVSGTLAMPRNSGKYYWEVYGLDVDGGVIGIGALSCANITGLASMKKIYGYSPNGQWYENDTGVAYGATWATGDTISILFDSDRRQITFWKNGLSQGLADTVANGYDYFPQAHCNDTSLRFNFGQNPFKFTPPAGYKTINTANLPSPGLTRPDKYVGISTWTGNETAGRQIDVGFKPDLIWGKALNDSTNFFWTDTVRGSNKFIYSSADSNEATTANILNVNDNNVKGFKLGSSGSLNGTSAYRYVGYSFKAGGNNGTWNIDDHGYASAADANMSVGALNSSTLNQSQTWSGLFTLASGSFDQAITNAFDGHISRANQARTSGNSVLITMTLSTPVDVSSEIRVFGERNYGSVCTVTLSGTTYTSTIPDGTAAPSGHHIFKVSGSLTQMTLTSLNPPGTGRTYMEGMMIDNKLLVDNGVSINKPSIAPSGASVGTKQGFSIIKYEGNGNSAQTIPHGLGKTPTQIMIKRLDGGSGNTGDWMMGGAGLTSWSYYLVPNKNQSEYNDFAPFGPEPTDSVFTVGSSDRVNNDGNNYIAYVWTDIPGVQKFGRYIGNGNADGAFINCGFKPALIVVKVITNGQSERWYLFDNKRDTYNSVHKYIDLGATLSEQTGTNPIVDFVSNGFKFRNGASNYWNGAYNYVYMAWAESPQFNLFGAQPNAR